MAANRVITALMSTDPTAACKGQELWLKVQFANILFLLERFIIKLENIMLLLILLEWLSEAKQANKDCIFATGHWKHSKPIQKKILSKE